MKRNRARFLPEDHEWPELRDQYVALVRAGYSAEEASKAITTSWFRKHGQEDAKAKTNR